MVQECIKQGIISLDMSDECAHWQARSTAEQLTFANVLKMHGNCKRNESQSLYTAMVSGRSGRPYRALWDFRGTGFCRNHGGGRCQQR